MTPKQQLAALIAKHEPAIARSAKQVLAELRPLFVGADELVYDYYNGLVIAWSPTGKGKDGIASIAIYPRWINLFLSGGPRLPDPTKRLKGTGTIVRHIVLDDGVATLKQRDVKALIRAAITTAKFGLDRKRKGALIIKPAAAKKRPRRPASK